MRRKVYSKLRKFKNLHTGKRCFIIATAPSLTLEDVNYVKNEITFSMNSCYKLFDKTDWRPTYYCLEDTSVYERIKDEIDRKELNEVFISDFIKWEDLTINRVPVIANWARTAREREIIPQCWQKKSLVRIL